MSIRKLIAAVATLMTIAFVSGCYSAPVMPPTGVIYSNIDAPTSLSIGGQDLGTRRGEASCVSLLGLFAWGDCSAKAAADDGAINELKQLDYNFFNFLFVWQSLTTIAYGD
jgi:hypothetical protein